MKSFCLLFCCCYCVNTFSQTPKLMLPIGHAGFMNSIAFSNDGKKVVTSGTDRTAKVWDVNTGLLLADCRGHTEPVSKAVFSNDGKWVLTCADDQSAIIWDAATGKERLSLKDPSHIDNIAFNNDDSRVLTSGMSITAKLWNSSNGKIVATLADNNNFSEARFSPDGKLIAANYWDDSVHVWDGHTGEQIIVFKEHTPFIEFDASGTLMVTGSVDSLTRLWNPRTGALVKGLLNKRGRTNAAAFSSNGKLLATCTYYGDLQIWDLNTYTLIHDWPKAGINAFSMSFEVHDQRLLLSGSEEAMVWDIPSGKSIFDKGVYDARYSRDGKKFAVVMQSKAVISDEDRTVPSVSLRGHVSWSVHADIDAKNKNFIVYSGNGALRLWDATTGLPRITLAEPAEGIQKALFDSAENKIIAVNDRGFVLAWDATTGKQLFSRKCYDGKISLMQLSSAGDKIAVLAERTLLILDADNGKLLSTMTGHLDIIYDAVFSKDGKLLITGSQDSTARVWDVLSGRQLDSTKLEDWVTAAHFNQDATKGLLSTDKEVRVWDWRRHSFSVQFTLPSDYSLLSADFSSDDRFIITTANTSGFVRIYDARTGRGLFELHGDTPFSSGIEMRSDNLMECYAINPNRTLIATGRGDGLIQVWDFHTGKLLYDLKGHTDLVHAVTFSPDSRFILSLSKDNTSKWWNIETKKLVFTFFPVDSTGYFIQNQEGYYRCSHDAARLLHYVTNDNQVIGFEQLDIKFNRPDLVLSSINPADTNNIAYYREAYLKRVRDLHIEKFNFDSIADLPLLQIIGRDAIDYNQKSDRIGLRIHVDCGKQLVSRLDVFVNEAPVYGSKGIDRLYERKHVLDTILSFRLSEGINNIQVSVMNEGGFTSYPYPLTVSYTPKNTSKKKFYFIGIGTRQFEDTSNNLRWCVKDIQMLAGAFKQKYKSAAVIHTLFDRQVTREAVKDLKHFLLESDINDKVVIAFSGHGLIENNHYYLSTFNTRFNNPEVGGLPYEELFDLMDGISARNKLMLIDACNSGELDTVMLASFKSEKNSLENEGVTGNEAVTRNEGGKAGKVNNIGKQGIGMQKLIDLTQELFVDIRQNNGANVIAASSAIQFAKEDNNLKHGVFTFSILEAFRQNKTLTISQLKQHVEKRVPELTHQLQKPTTRNQTIYQNWVIW